MKVFIARIPEEGSNLAGDESAEEVGLVNDPVIKVAGDVHYTFYVQKVSGELVVRGGLSVDVELQCARCSEFFSTTVTDSDFLRAYPVNSDTDAVDISADMRESLLLEIPGHPICDTACNGLCPQCGENLNIRSCNCRSAEETVVWGELDKLDLISIKEGYDGCSKKKNVKK